jgi:alcohol dehydrogenase
MSLVAGRELELVGSHGFSGDELGELLQLVSSGDLDPAVLVEKEVSLSEGAKAIEAMDKGSPVGITMVTNFHDSRL